MADDYQSTPPPTKKQKLSAQPLPDWSDLYPELLGYQSTPPPTKKQKLSAQPLPDWSDLYPELLGIVLQRLPLVDVYRSKAVCSSWCSSAKSYMASPSFSSHVDQTPWLVLPKAKEDDKDEESDANYDRFYNISEKKFYTINNLDDIHGWWCIGSSLGWLVILDEKAKPYLTDPFSSSKIELPLLNALYETMGHGEDYFVRFLRKRVFNKAILTTKPSRSKSFGVVVLYGGYFCSSLACYRNGDSEWTKFGETSHYTDIISHENMLFALTAGASFEVWNIERVTPTQIANIKPYLGVWKELNPRDQYIWKQYLVKSEGTLLLAWRFVGHFVDPNGKMIAFRDLPLDQYGNPVTCRYKTTGFLVYKLDMCRKKWERMESIGDRILFLGGNQSVLKSAEEIPGCEGDSIYFTDDDRERCDWDYKYGGLDMGRYSLKDGRIHSLYPRQPLKSCPAPFFLFST